MSLSSGFDTFKSATYWKATSKLGKGFAAAYPADAQKVSDYVAKLAAGDFTAAPPSCSTAHGQGLVAMLAGLASQVPAPTPTPDPAPSGYALAWADEFDGASIDATKWNVRDNTTTNNQLAQYMARNAILSGGQLTLRAIQETVGTKAYSSAYLDTIGKFAQQYGRWEVRAKLPQAQGMWPAFWLRGNAGLGELDIMEAVGGLPTTTVQTVHQSTNGDMDKAGHEDHLPSGTTADWHVYAVEREPGYMKWYVDDRLVFTVTSAQKTWLDSTFNEPMNIRLNLQVGGSMPNWYQKPVGSIPAGQGDFVVDYVRFYKKTA